VSFQTQDLAVYCMCSSVARLHCVRGKEADLIRESSLPFPSPLPFAFPLLFLSARESGGALYYYYYYYKIYKAHKFKRARVRGAVSRTLPEKAL